MVDTTPVTVWQSNWTGSIATVPARYTAGINAAVDVVSKMLAGQSNYETQMSNPAVLARRATGITEKVTDASWKLAATTLGAARIGTGMTAGTDRFNAAATKNHGIVTATVLTPRTADWMGNLIRVQEMVAAFKSGWGKL